MFENFPDDLTLQHHTGKDHFGNPVYDAETTIKGRRCKQETVLDYDKERISNNLRYIYHIELDTVIAVDDLLDGKVVKQVAPIRGADNVYHFVRVVCM